MALVLAIEPDHRQAAILKRVIRESVKADLVLVDSRDAAITAIDAQIPDVILVTALLSPRDEEELVTHLRALEGAEHLQTHTIPQLAGSRADDDGRSGQGGLLGKFRKKSVEPMAGCDPEMFAEEIRTFIARATQMKQEAVASLRNRVAQLEAQVDTPQGYGDSARGGINPSEFADASAQQQATNESSAWDSPFEWRRSEPPPALARTNQTAPPREPPQPPSLITNVPLAVLAAEEETEQREAERRRLEEERVRLEAAAAAERERAEQLRQEAERARADAEAQATAAAARAREEERKKAEATAKAVADKAREEERKRLEAEAKAAAQRARDEERRRAEGEAKAAAEKAREEERKRLEAEAKAAAQRAREEERKRAEAEAKAAAERAREEERKKAEAAAKAAAEKAREDERRKLEAKLAAERAKEAERRRVEAEAAAAREREAERLRKEAEVTERKRVEERKRLEAEMAAASKRAREEEQRRLEAERKRLEAEALVERERAERRRIEEEAAAERERAAVERERAAAERELAAAAERERQAALERAREAAEAERKEQAAKERAAQRKKTRRAARAGQGGDGAANAPLVTSDHFAEFREEYDHVGPGVFRHMPLAGWARTDHPAMAPESEPAPPDDLRELMNAWKLPPHISGVTLPRGCRIRRVRVPAAAGVQKERGARPVIVSRRALDEARSGEPG